MPLNPETDAKIGLTYDWIDSVVKAFASGTVNAARAYNSVLSGGHM